MMTGTRLAVATDRDTLDDASSTCFPAHGFGVPSKGRLLLRRSYN